MDTSRPDFGIVERTWEGRLRERGLNPTRVGEGIATGHDQLEMLYRLETEAAEVELDEEPRGKWFIGSVEVKIVLKPPGLGTFDVRDLVTHSGPSLDDALAACANTFMDVTFPSLEALFTGKRPEGPGTGKVTLNSFTIELDRAIAWDVMLGQLQILNDPDGVVRERLRAQPPLMLIMNALTNHLSRPTLHWCKVYGSNRPNGVTLNCAIDSHRSPEAGAEMAAGFGEPLLGDWEFRQFMTIRPIGDADAATTEKLRAQAAETFRSKKSWWSRLFGR